MNALLPMLIPALFLGLSLALDCFAISISQGIKTTRWRPVLTLAILFGVFQAGMLLLGHFTGGLIAGLLSKGMNLLAAALLMGIGAKMLIESHQASDDSSEDSAENSQEMTRMRDYLLLSIATSLDALAGGLSLSSLKIDTWLATVMVFGFSFGLAMIGGHFGTRLGERFGQRAEVFGGLVLIVLGLKAMWG